VNQTFGTRDKDGLHPPDHDASEIQSVPIVCGWPRVDRKSLEKDARLSFSVVQFQSEYNDRSYVVIKQDDQELISYNGLKIRYASLLPGRAATADIIVQLSIIADDDDADANCKYM
jgi:hypothetical protein